jgi:hypothetical protein
VAGKVASSPKTERFNEEVAFVAVLAASGGGRERGRMIA